MTREEKVEKFIKRIEKCCEGMEDWPEWKRKITLLDTRPSERGEIEEDDAQKAYEKLHETFEDILFGETTIDWVEIHQQYLRTLATYAGIKIDGGKEDEQR